MATVDELNFRLIIDDSEFNKQIDKDIKAAERLNTEISQLLEIKEKTRDIKVSVDTTEAVGGLKELNDYYRQLEEAEWSKIGEGLNVEEYVQNTLTQLRQLEEEIEVIQELRRENPEGEGLAQAYKSANEQAQRLLATIQALREAEHSLGGGDTQFREYIRSLTEPSMEYLQLVEQMKEEERVSKELEKAKLEEAKAREKAATARQKERNAASKSMDAEFKEYIASLTQVNDELEEMGRYYRELEKESEKTEKVTQSFSKQSTVLRQLKSLASGYISVLGAKNLVSNIVRVTAEFELQRTTLAAILQDAWKANELYEQMKGLAVKSPFNFKELATYAKQLSAYSIPAKELYETTKMLADVSAGLGVGMDRLVLAYGQIRSASFLRGQEVRQLTEAGIPILEELRKQFVELGEEAITVGDVFDKISTRQVPFEMVAKVFKDMTSEGGKFYQMQEVQAETLRGKLSNLKDAYQIMFSEIGDRQSGLLKGTVDFLRMLIENYEKVGKVILELVSGFGVYSTAVIIAEVANKKFVLSNHSVLSSLANIGKRLKAFIASNPYAAMAAAATTLVVALVKVGKELWGTSEAMKHLQKAQEEYEASVISEEVALDTLYAKLKLAKEGTQDYESARKSILSKYKPYIDALREEGKEVNDLAGIYADLKEKVIEAARARFMDSASEQAKNDLAKRTEEIQKSFTDRFKKGWKGGPKGFKEATAVQKEAMWRFITGGIDYNELRRYVPAGWAGFIDWMRKDFKEAADEYREIVRQIGEVETAFNDTGNNTDALSGWRKEVESVLNTFEKKGYKVLGLTVNSTTSLDEYVSNLAKERKELNAEMAIAEKNDKDLYEEDKKRLEVIEGINKSLHGALDSYEESKKRGNSEGKTQEQKDIETRIDLLKKLQSAYEQLKEYVSKERMPNVLQNLFSASDVPYDMVKRLDFVEQLTKEAEKLSKFDPEAADRLLSSLAKDPTSRLVESAKALEKYREEMQKLLAKDFDVKDANLGYDISKIISNLTTANQQARLTADNLKKDLLDQEDIIKANVKGNSAVATAYWLAYKAEAEKAIDEITQKEIEANKKAAQEKLNDLANKAYKDVLLNNGLNSKMLSDWGDKSLEQINDIAGKLENALKGDNILLGVSDEVKKSAEQAGLSLDTLRELIKAMLNIELDNTSDEGFKKKLSLTKSITSEASRLAGSFTEIGDALNNGTLQSLGEVFDLGLELTDAILGSEDVIKDIADNAGEITSSISVITMIVKVVIIMIEKIVDFFASSARAEQQAIDNAREFQRALRDIKAEADDGIFGDSQWTKTLSRLQDYKDKYVSTIGELQKEIAKGNEDAWWYSIAYWGTSNPSDENLLAAYNAGLYNDEASAVIETLVKFRDSVSEIFSGLSDDIVNNMVGAFEETGDSAAHLEDAFASMGDSLVRSIMKSYLLQGVFKKYEEQIFAAIDNFASSDRSQENIKRGIEEVKGVFDLMSADIQSLAPFFNELLGMGKEMFGAFEGGAESLADGIKGITEDTANLLASYLNAIRADVSFNKTQIATISADIKQILGLLPASPTLNDYLNQIQANTFDTAQSNREILSEIRSMVGLGGEGSALRVITT